MSAVHVRDLPPEIVEALKRRATAHHRSLQMELRAILVRAAEDAPPAVAFAPIRLAESDAVLESGWSREEIYGDDGR